MSETTFCLAAFLYETYCAEVGGKAFNGDPLPSWEEFSADPAKQKQADAWRKVSEQVMFSPAEGNNIPTDDMPEPNPRCVITFEDDPEDGGIKANIVFTPEIQNPLKGGSLTPAQQTGWDIMQVMAMGTEISDFSAE